MPSFEMQVPNRVVHCGTIDLIRRTYVRFLAASYTETTNRTAPSPACDFLFPPFPSLYFTGGIPGIGKADGGIGELTLL